ncbi:MAG: proteasome subunit beta [Actinomycetota bacterium]|nr:proteasome subunit beta [Actinomycetota bacterium]
MTTGMPIPPDDGTIVPAASFSAVLKQHHLAPSWEIPPGSIDAPEATTILAMRWADGVVMAGDRRATAGSVIAHRRIKKVYPADDRSAVAISGTAGMAVELTKLFQTELEHYEKIEDTRLSLDGKANFLARLVRGNLPLAFQGLIVVPLFCGYDDQEEAGKIYSYDVVGGRYDEQDYATTGSGGAEARAFLKSAWNDGLDEAAALHVAIEALVAAAEEDSATGGPDPKRGIYPNVVTVTAEGYREIPDEEIAPIAIDVMEGRP